MTKRFRKIIHDEAEIGGEHVSSDDVHLPTRDIGVGAVNESWIVIDGR